MGAVAIAAEIPIAPTCIAHTLTLPRAAQPVLAMGAWLKSTLCAASGTQAYISREFGNLDTPQACIAHEQAAHTLLDWLGETPRRIAHDLHPDFYSTRLAAELASAWRIPLLAVQHHHAHIAALAAEHGSMQPMLGLALDGIGMGTDGAAWGGELLYVNGADCRRLGYLHPLALPGGDRAAQEPWRMAAAALHALGRHDEIVQRYANQPGAATIAGMLQRDLNCPRTSSMGRLFDAAAGLLGTCAQTTFEAEAAIGLEALAARHGGVAPLADGYKITENNTLDFRPLLAHLANCTDAAYGAALFHATLAAGLADWVERAADACGISVVGLGGGCFLNRILSQALASSLGTHGMTVIQAQHFSPGDSAISLGQAWIAMHHD